MEIKTKFGPAAIIMDNTGAKIGIVKQVMITMVEGAQEPIIMYRVTGNGQTYDIDEKMAIGLMPRIEEANKVAAAA
jgi:hypothetical protein